MFDTSPPGRMMFFLPDDPALLAAMGAVAVRHGHLEFVLRRTVKTLTRVTPEQGDNATEDDSASVLDQRIRRLARAAWGEGRDLVLLQDILVRAKRASKRRNELMHGLVAQVLDGDPMHHARDVGWRDLPTVSEVQALADTIWTIAVELNSARLEGFIAEAMKRTE
jgi:hypothetical protein